MPRSSSKLDIWNRALFAIGETKFVMAEDEARPAAEACARAWDDVLEIVLGEFAWPWAMRERPLVAIDEQVSTQLYASGVNPWTTWTIPFPFADPSQVSVVHIGATGTRTDLVADTGYTLPDVGVGADATIVLTAALVAGESVEITVTTSRVGWEHVYPLPADCVTPVAILVSGTRFRQTPVESRVPFEVVADDVGEWFLVCCDLAESDIAALQYVARQEQVALLPRPFVEALVWRLAEAIAVPLTKDEARAQRCHARYLEELDRAICRANNTGHDTDPETPSLAARD
jgi:hypothetical protein